MPYLRIPDEQGTRSRSELPRRQPPPGRSFALTLCAAVLLITGCDTALDRPTITTGTAAASAASTAPTTVTITPVTPNGLLTGPGVTDESITVGLLVDPERDRGFSDGIALWQEAVNSSGGLCGRAVVLAESGTDGVSPNVVDAYEAIGRSVIGLITLPPPSESVALNSRIVADQTPTLTPTGTSAQLGPSRPIVIGATEDILAINALDHLEQAGRIEPGGVIGVLTDGSAAADNALQGASWWAGEHEVALDVRRAPPEARVAGETDSAGATTAGATDAASATSAAGAPDAAGEPWPADLAEWGDATHVLALTDAATTSQLVAAIPATSTVVTMIDGYDPDQWSAAALAVAAAGRVLVSTAAPAYGSDYPAAVAVSSRAAAVGGVTPGPRLFDGYATGQSWARLLTQACADQMLTRVGIGQAAVTVGPASVDSLFGPTDPSAALLSGLPATRVSAMSTADPSATGGLTPLTWPESAAGIEDYVP